MSKVKNEALGFVALTLAVLALVAADVSIKYLARGGEADAQAQSSCTVPQANTTFIKALRILVFTKINGTWPTKDGGYIVSGTTDPNIMFIPPDGFVAKLDKQGNVQWLKLLKTTNAAGAGNPKGDEDVQAIIELNGGGYLMVSKIWGFIKAAEWKAENTELNKIMFTKLDKQGNMVWSKSFTGFVEDAKNSLLETEDGGFVFYAGITDLAPDDRGEDSEVYYDMPFSSLKVFKFDKNGSIQWSKNLENFISRKSDSYLVKTSDGGYALAGNVGEKNPERKAPYDFDTYPGLVKFDKDFNFQWAKSMEGIPLEMAAALQQPDGSFKLGSTQMRQGAINVRGLVKAPDNGYVVLGTLSSALSLFSESLDLKSGQPHSYLVGFKFNSSGGLEWVRKLTMGYKAFNGPMTNFSVASSANNDIIITGPMTWAADDYAAKAHEVTVQKNWYIGKYGELEMLKEDKAKSKQSREDWKKVTAAINAASDATRPAVMMLETNQDLTAKWAKIAYPQRSIINFALKPTADGGAVMAGEYETKDIQSVILSSITYYKDGFMVKFDASGNVKNNSGWLSNYSGDTVVEAMTPYTKSNDLTVRIQPYVVKMTDRKPEFSATKKFKLNSFAAFASSANTACPVAPGVSAYDAPLQNSTSTSSVTRTWPLINYEKAVPVETINEKSKNIHNEMLPILKQLFNSQVKLTDNMGGSMLDYIFGRMVTGEDKTAVKKYLEGIGYKTQDETEYQLTMFKVGYFLTITFSVNNTNKGFMEITY